MIGKWKRIFATLLCIALLNGCGIGVSSSISEDDLESKPNVSEQESSSIEETAVRYWRERVNFGIAVKDGVMWLGNEKMYDAGVNCYDLFNQCFADGYRADKAKAALDVLSAYNVKVVRFNCGGYSSSFIHDYYANIDAYVRLLGEIAAYAETLEIGLIPSFFWLHHAVPDYFDEPIRSWGKEDSQTVGFLRSYTEKVVCALKDYKSVFAWEFGNEFNLSCDLPNAAELVPALPVGSKREKRTEEDYLSVTDVNFALQQFSSTIHRFDDTGRMITSGNATLRPSQYNQWFNGTWKQDSVLEFKKITGMFTPDGVDTVCEHVYFTSQTTFEKELSLSEYLQYATANAKALDKAYFIGEWGGGSSEQRSYYWDIGKAFIDAGVQLALLWNYNLKEGSIEYSFSAETERGEMMLSVVEQMNLYYDEIFG